MWNGMDFEIDIFIVQKKIISTKKKLFQQNICASFVSLIFKTDKSWTNRASMSTKIESQRSLRAINFVPERNILLITVEQSLCVILSKVLKRKLFHFF